MAKKVGSAQKPTKKKTTAVVVREVALSAHQNMVLAAETPAQFVKTKPGRGGKKVQYIEGGYVVSQLNAAFSPFGWEFEIVEQGQTDRKNENSSEGEVWVRGKLTIVDHVNGYRVSKTQYGQHPIHNKVPIGDAFKSAGTDALKKCASMLGIGLDIYWGQLDLPEKEKPQTTPKQDKAELFERAKAMIRSTREVDALLVYDAKLTTSTTFSPEQRVKLRETVKQRIEELQNGTQEVTKS